MWLLTVRDLKYRARRVAVVVTAMALVLVLLFLMTGLVEQFNKEPSLSTEAIGATDWILPAGVAGPFTSSATMDDAVAADIQARAEVDQLVVARANIDGTDEAIVIGHEIGGRGTPDVVAGRAAEQAGDVVVDESSGFAVGSQVEIGGQVFDIVGQSQDTTLLAGIPLVFVTIDDARNALFGGTGVVSALVSDEPVDELPDAVVHRSAVEVADNARGPLESAIASIDLIRTLLWIVVAVVLGGIVFLTALERERDFAVLKATGAGDLHLTIGLLTQAIIITMAAFIVAAVAQRFIVPVFPLTVRIPARAFIQIPLVALAVSLVASQAGLRRLRRSDPLIAFEGR